MGTDLWLILRRNLFTPFVFIVALLVGALLFLGEKADALFLISTIAFNSIIGIIQEIRAKRALQKLELLARHRVRRHTKDGVHFINPLEIEVGDHLELRTGDPIPVDGIIIESTALQVNESLLTGEAKEIDKAVEDTLLGGSIVVSGRAIYRVATTFEMSRASQMTGQLKTYNYRPSPLQRSLNRILQILTYIAISISIIIVIDGHQNSFPLTSVIATIVAGALTLVPEGLVLANTLLFTYGSLRLARQKVLIQRLASLEGFGRLTTLCLDKTGTLTTGSPELEALVPLGEYDKKEIQSFITALYHAEPSPTLTLKALKPLVHKTSPDLLDQIAFSSTRKYSAVTFGEASKWRSVALGAPEILKNFTPFSESLNKLIESYTSNGGRVLLLVDLGSGKKSLEESFRKGGKPAALVVLSSELRPNIIDTVFYLQAQGVTLKILSGDSPETVQHLAQKIGIREWQAVLTGDQLAELDHTKWEKAIPQTTIFARILPEQKERIIGTLQRRDFTGMVGDGVNDALALKKADLSVAMLEGHEASRQIADVVLLNNDFATFPIAMRLATQIILGLEMVACLFFNKISYGLTILILTISLNSIYPLSPRHVLLVNFICVGLPSLLWSIFPPRSSHRLDPNFFFRRVFMFSIPNGLITGLAIMSGSLISRLQGYNEYHNQAVFITLGLGIFTFWLIPHSLQAIDSLEQRRWQKRYIVGSALIILILSNLPFVRDFFEILPPSTEQWVSTLTITGLAGTCQWLLLKKKTYRLKLAFMQ